MEKKCNLLIVDDEIMIIRSIMRVLDGSKFSYLYADNPLKAVDILTTEAVDIILTDQRMPDMTGLELLKKAKELSPDTLRILMSGYSDIDIVIAAINDGRIYQYITKPWNNDGLIEIMNDAIQFKAEEDAKKNCLSASLGFTERRQTKSLPGDLYVNCFGKFRIYRADSEPVKWRTEKAKELIALLIYRNGHEVTRDEIIELLWPEVDLDRAIHYLHNSIYYIRKSLEDYRIDRSCLKISGNYTVYIGSGVIVDLKKYADLLQIKEKDAQLLQSLYELTQGEFMEGEDWDWAQLDRENFANKQIETALKLSALYQKNGSPVLAEEVLRRAYRSNPFEESVTLALLELYKSTGQKMKASKHYAEFFQLMKKELGIVPDRDIRILFESIK